MKEQQEQRIDRSASISTCTSTCTSFWSRLTEDYFRAGIRRGVVGVGTVSARHPWTTVILTCVVSLALVVIGYFTNFQLDLNQLHFVTPTNSLPDIHSRWIQNENKNEHANSGFPNVREYNLNIHRNGDNVLDASAMEVALEAMEVLQTTPHYNELCRTCSECTEAQRNMLFDGTSATTMNTSISVSPYCFISSVTQFWDHSLDKFQQEQQLFLQMQTQNYSSSSKSVVNSGDDDYVRQVVSQPTYPDGTPVYHEAILGKFEGYNTTSGKTINYKNAPPLSLRTAMEIYQTNRNTNANGKINSSFSFEMNNTPNMYVTSAECLPIRVDIPDVGSTTDEFERQVLQRLAKLQNKYRQNHNSNDNRNDQQQQVHHRAVELEYFTMNGYQYEMMRALYIDLPLVAVLVVVMVAFAVLVFSDRHDRIQSRGMVGLYSFTTIGLSLLAGYGIMFIIGVPITTLAIMIPFVVCGVGLDDTFIITGTYFRLVRQEEAERRAGRVGTEEGGQPENEPESDDNNHDTTIIEQERKRATTLRIVQATLDEVAVSITMTTITTLLAFITGGTSHIPAVRWLCWYAAISLFIVYVFQITCFIGLLVLDERRVQAKRKDLCIWMFVINDDDKMKEDTIGPIKAWEMKEDTKEPSDELEMEEDIKKLSAEENLVSTEGPTLQREKEESGEDRPKDTSSNDTGPTTMSSLVEPSKSTGKSFPERLMGWYADQLLKPISKVIVLVVFALYFAGTVYSTTLLHQEFKIKDYIPKDSYMTSSMRSYAEYSTYLIYIEVYFRNVDQSDPEVQLQMSNYVQDLSDLPQVGGGPGFFWERDFRLLAESNQTEELIGIDLESLSFNEQVNLALSIPQLRQIYGRDIVRDPESGNITASRTSMFLRDFGVYDVQEQLDLLLEQRDISLRQPVNDQSERIPGEGLNFFTFADLYFYWELFARVVHELIFNTVLCVIVVSAITFVLIPHWSAVCFACPLLIILYFNLMGTMQYCGVEINVISYFILVMSIGLLVDFLMHVLLRFYESKGATRNEKVKETLETIGASILMGAFTTFLGVIPLAFSTTKIFNMVFICFLAMVILGCAAGLILLPVLLSLVGPVGGIPHDGTDSKSDEDNERVGNSKACEFSPNT